MELATKQTDAKTTKEASSATTAAKKRRRKSQSSNSTRAKKQSRTTRVQIQAVQNRSKAKQELNHLASDEEILGLAASCGDLSTVKKILSKNPELINKPTNGDAYTPLHQACKVIFCSMLPVLFFCIYAAMMTFKQAVTLNAVMHYYFQYNHN